jgi:hypothetical protein
MKDPKVISITDARHLSKNTPASKVGCRDARRIGEAMEVAPMEACGG